MKKLMKLQTHQLYEEEAKKKKYLGLTDEEIKEMKSIYEEMTGEEGKIEAYKVSQMLPEVMEEYSEQANYFLKDLENKDQKMTFEEFLDSFQNRMANRETKDGLGTIFFIYSQIYGKDFSNGLGSKQIKDLMKAQKIEISDNEAKLILEQIASDKSSFSNRDHYTFVSKKPYPS